MSGRDIERVVTDFDPEFAVVDGDEVQVYGEATVEDYDEWE